jgi:GT2 family glycosyltransferase
MHRSGTSLVASWLASAGIDLGERFLAPDTRNPKGYFEDLAFLDLDRRMLREAVPVGEAGHPDWGWTESERLDRRRFAQHVDAARGLIAGRSRNGSSGHWGWKDPRTTLLLNFWDELLPTARYVLVYRFPWEVADSMQRLGADVFLEHPDYAYRIWTFYNRHLLDFYLRHRERCLLISANALFAGSEPLRQRLARKLGFELPEVSLAPLIDQDLFLRIEGSDPLIALATAAHPGTAALLRKLDSTADLSGAGLWSAAPADGRRLAAAGAGFDRPIDLSIVIPCHDDGELLIEAVASAERSAPERAELLTELLIVNDGSREARTLEVLDLLRQAGYTVIDQENAGLAAARNHGIRAARGRYLLPLDADNRLRPGFPGAAVAALDGAPELGVVYGNRQEFGCRHHHIVVSDFDVDDLLRANFIDACAVLRREVWEQCGGYDGAMPEQGWEDWDLWLGAAERGWRFHRLSGVTFEYRVRPGSMASRLLGAEIGVPLRLYMIDKHRDLYRRRLPQLLTAQHHVELAHAELRAAAAELAASRAESGAIAALRDDLAGRLSAVETDLAAAVGEQARLSGERDRLYAELASYRRRVEFMEGTRAWRVRRWILRLRGREPHGNSE